ncbi:MAG TPA: DUF4258 domain-containing protein [Candidatus Wolfebacteria bacterium]|nr:DUF4258 domain-containing protein [Candidatus Wolfebacteria bacterium]
MNEMGELDFHPHILKRMVQRGVTKTEVESTLEDGKFAENAKEGTIGKVQIFKFEGYWEGKYYKKKEVSVYYKTKNTDLILLTVIARYGNTFD